MSSTPSADMTGSLSRRRLLQAGAVTLAAASVSALTPESALGAESTDLSTGFRIDIHHHQIDDQLHATLVQFGLLPPVPAGGPPFVAWSTDTALAMMDNNRIGAAVLSAPIPDAFFPSAGALSAAARGANEAMAATVAATPNRFGFFAYLPLPHVDLALAELTYALDTLHADGVVLMAHAGGKYLGDSSFDAVFDELNRRGTVVFTHPFELPGGAAPGIYGFLADYMLDTTRAAIRMIQTGTLDRYPNVKIILPHGGGFLPYLGSRLELGQFVGSGADAATIRTSLRRFYYDTAMWTSPYATPSLLRAADPQKIIFGTDFNAVPAVAVNAAAAALDTDPLIPDVLRVRINRNNALSILPQLAARLGG
jgi:6-methylsalicylate decarboxylase